MSDLDFTNQRERLRKIVENALTGCSYESSHEEEGGRVLIIEARRPDGRFVHLRFRGVRDSEATDWPAPGSHLSLRGIGTAGKFSLLRLLGAPTFGDFGSLKVKLRAGDCNLDIVCEDAEWWEETLPGESGYRN
jgi:hypothetical protein